MRHVMYSLIALSLAACGFDREPLRSSSSDDVPPALDDSSPASSPSAPSTPSTPVRGADGLPDSLRCVSAPIEGTTDVVRVELFRQDEGFTASVTHGPLFWSHGGVWFGSDGAAWPEATTRTLALTAKGTLVERTASGTLTIDLARDGAVFTGSFVDDQCYVHEAASLTCWNDGELFGSSWTGEVGALAARFDWVTGACTDENGRAARNQMPIEIVRETAFAECTDLTGRLNGDDFGYPDLTGWDLAGANLDDAELFFANLTFATLHGAQLGGLSFGYATVSGSFDEATEQPRDGACAVDESPWGGSTLTCVQ